MKRFFISLVLTAGLWVGCGQPNKPIDITGDYQGMIPCGSCEGIEVALTLDKEGYFIMEETFLDEEKTILDYKGDYQLQDDVISLIIEGDMPVKLKVSGEELHYLGEDNQPIKGYSLQKK